LAVPGLVFAFGFIGAFMGTILDNRVNPFPLLIAAYAVRRLPAMVRSATAGLQEASRSLEEAALMVGASPLKVTRRITFPLIRRHLIVGAMLTFTYSMIEVSDSLLLALEAKFYPVAKAIYALMGRGDGIEVASALGVLVMVLMLITFYLSERLSRGLSLTRGVKGLIIIGALAPTAVAAETDELVGISPHWEAIRYEFTTGFAKQWKERTGRDLTIRWLDIGGTSDIIKYVRGQFKQEPNGIGIDFVFGGGSDSYIELERLGALEPATIAPEVLREIPPQIAGVPLYSERLTWFANALAAFGIIYNKAAVERLKLPTPRAWSDLADPRYFGYVGASDPRKSGSMHTMYEIILQGYGWTRGWEILQKISRNVGHFMGSASQVGKEIATGEVIYGVTIDTYAAETIHQVGAERVSFVVPSDFAVVNGDAIGMLKGAPNPRAASAFIEFTLSEAGQRIWYSKVGAPGGPIKTALGKLSVLPSLYGQAEPAGIFKDNPFTLPQIMAYDAAKAAARWNLVNDLFGVFIIDSHKRLKRAPSAEQLYGIPVSESEAVLLGANGGWGADSGNRTTQLQRWSEAAAAALPLQTTPLDRLRWLPGVIFVCGLIWMIFRRLT
ncbi:MAG: extracellular solute-binding protein, partial [Pseudomonadota bacterium]